MWKIFGGGILVVGGIAAFVEAHRHIPVPARQPEVGLVTPASGLSNTAYDLLRIGGWALVVFGILLAVLGLIGYGARYAAASQFAERSPAAGMSANGVSEARESPPEGKPPGAGDSAATRLWDGGAHGEAVEPH
jgi:hypothetical protein